MANRLSSFSPYQRAIAKGHLCSCGTAYADLDKPIIAVVNSWNEIVPGHAHLRDLAAHVKQGIADAGALPLEFSTIAVCDGITQSHSGMKYVLPSRELIADSIEIMVRGHGIFDGMVLLGSCDKVVPAMLMAAARLNIPAIMLTGGPMVNRIKPKQSKAARQSFIRGEIDEKALVDVTLEYYPHPGICPFLGTANTMCIVAEALGLTLPGSGTAPALSAERDRLAYATGQAIVDLVNKGITPRTIMTRAALENALTVVLAIGGSLNTVLHLPAIAHEAGLSLTMADFDRISKRTPLITRIYPNSDEYTVADLHPVGGIPTLMKELAPLLDLSVLTVTGRTLADNLSGAKGADGQVIRPLSVPYQSEGGITVLQGNLAPDGAVVKSSAVPRELWQFRGPARVFESEEECMAAADAGTIKSGEVIIIRNEGPVGGPGMREMHRATEILSKVGRVAIITDGRFSGASGGLAIGYLSPEAALGGPIGLVATGDIIAIDIAARTLTWEVDDKTAAQRRAAARPRRTQTDSTFLRLYSAATLSAAQGAIRKRDF
ncbi:Dihydroxy-acid dehydratase [Thermosinus carboxydivorans Nor1]|uniref:Dihydroxy-acid dehydratase n=1 Tax=Thermosinus carboxydivorans Nor1 TaxID=401526 RepID=A1HMS2_9FIRM|nr:dihydroxy-acid dehydratase [Thermosinus carboxydivorans]EAX48559.1 Dihydroxy-acid dehydratase [Thermosinus carboxydivorans Nor1]